MSTRRLAAIMFTDIVGYTAIMQSDESQALLLRQRHREVFEESHKAFQGNILQYYGDGTLSIFDSATDAVKCAVEMQLAFQQEPKVPLRIGIHTGDILYSKEEAVGDGVNVASRVESLAAPGSIFLSESVQRYVRNQVEIPLKSMGEFTFKNVDTPMEVFAVDREGIVVPEPKTLTGKFVKHRRPGQQNLLQRLPIWAKYVGGFLLFLVLAPIIYFPLLQVFSSQAADGDMVTVIDEMGHTTEHMLIRAEDKTRFYVTSFDIETNDSSLLWAAKAIPYALEMDWDQDPYVYNIYNEYAEPASLNEELIFAKKLDCQFVLKGNVERNERIYRVGIRTYSVARGQMEQEHFYEGKDLLRLLDTVSLETKRILGVPQDHLEHVKDLPIWQFLTDSEAAFQTFGEALSSRVNRQGFPFEKLYVVLEKDSTFAWAANYTSSLLHRYQRSQQMALALSDQAMRHRKRLPEVFEAEVRQTHYQITDQPDKALQLAQMLIKLHPENVNYHISLIQGLFRQDRYEETLNAVEAYRKVTGDPTDFIYFETVSLARMGRLEEAIQKGESFGEQNPEETTGLLQLGFLYLQNKEWDKAQSMIEKANLLSPESPAHERLLESIQFQRDSGDLITPALLQEMEGTYWVERFTNFEIQMTTNNGLLYGQATNQGKYEVYPMSSNSFTAGFDFLVKFGRDEQGRIDRLFNAEGGRPYYRAIKMEPQMLKGIDLFREGKWQEAKEELEIAVADHPQHVFLQQLLQHMAYRESPQFSSSKKAYSSLTGTYTINRTEAEISLDGEGDILYQIDGSAAVDPIRLYEIEKDVFTHLFSLNNTLKVIRKRGVPVALESMVEGAGSFQLKKVQTP